MGYKGRDIEVATLNEEQYLVAACDSSGGIGTKELDVVRVSPNITGRFAARVALLEILSVGAMPRIIAVTVTNELEPTGKAILQGVRDELASLGMSSLSIVVSTEKNMPTLQTGVGVSVTGLVKGTAMRVLSSQVGDLVYCLGIPKVGAEVTSAEDPEAVQGKHIISLLNNVGVHDIVPVGSQGIKGEAELLAREISCRFEPIPCHVDLFKSGGPSTCLIFTSSVAREETWKKEFGTLPLFLVGALVEGSSADST